MTQSAAAAKLPAMGAEPADHREQLKIVIVGHVDHGKSTLVGRLFYDTGSLPDGKYEQIQQMCQKRGMPFEWSFLMDALQAERDQGITIDTTQIWFKTDKRDYVIIDAPGHKEFLKNMVTGAASSDAALLIIDAKEGVREQSKRHGYLLHLLGVRQIAVLVNKMDMVDYSEERFREIERDYTAYLNEIGVTPTYFVPISARAGDCIVNESDKMSWYKGPSVTQALDHFKPSAPSDEQPLRLAVQDVYKFDERRIIAGRIESGSLSVGDELLFSPSNTRVTVASIESWNTKELPQTASAGESVGITLSDQIFVERGHVASHVESAPKLTNVFKARIFWLGHKPLEVGKRYKLKLNTAEHLAEVKSIETVIQPDTLERKASSVVERSYVAEVVFRVRGMAVVDDFIDNARMGRFVIIQDFDVVGGGIIDMNDFADLRVAKTEAKSQNIFTTETGISAEQRAVANGHTGGILWFTGLSGAGKSTIASELERQLFARGYRVYVLDGDNLRNGLNSDLGFSPDDRTENIRRAGEVAALFAKAGVIVIASFISPYGEDRRRARAASPDHFNLVYIKADVETCEKRDVKGLYKKARQGEIKNFTGISAPYEEPVNSDIEVDTANRSIEECVDQLVQYVEREFVEPVRSLEVEGIMGGSRNWIATGI